MTMRFYFDESGLLQEVRTGNGRGLSEERKRRIEAAYDILEEIQPTSVRAVCYRLFTEGLISSMAVRAISSLHARKDLFRGHGS